LLGSLHITPLVSRHDLTQMLHKCYAAFMVSEDLDRAQL
jgi:hypothetical protein